MQLIKRQSMTSEYQIVGVESEIKALQEFQTKELCVTICAHAQPNGRIKYFIFMQIFLLIVRCLSFANRNLLYPLSHYPLCGLWSEYLL